MSHSRFGSSIYERYTLIVFAKRSLPKIRHAENAVTPLYSNSDARWIVQVSLYNLGTLLLKKSRGF